MSFFKCRELDVVSAFHFPPGLDRARKVSVPLLIPLHESYSNPRVPAIEAMFERSGEIHDSLVYINDMGIEHKFLFSYTFNARHPRNHALARILPQVEWRGELVVMSAGERKTAINIRCRKSVVHAATRL
jgi:hypothetical protein